MGATFLMSYPGSDWHIRGGENFRSQGRAAANPRRALGEWLALCDAILRAGGHVLVMPPAREQPLTGMIYTANAGQLFHIGDDWVYLVSKMAVPHRQAERSHVRAFIEKAGIVAREAEHVWEGQADVQHLGGNRFICTWGVRSVRESLAEVHALLPPSARVLDLRIVDPFFHGDTCLNPLTNRSGDTVLLAHGGALHEASGGLPAIRSFLGDRVEVIQVDRDDALGYACNALCVNGTVLLPRGLSTALRGQLMRRGFLLEELDFDELFGKGGGGPRCLVNELRGLVVNSGAPDFASQRDSLYALLDKYPESAPEPPPAAAPAPKSS